MIITYGSMSRNLAKSVSQLSGLPVVDTGCRRFPDGEQFVRVLGDVSGEDVAVIHTTGLKPDTLLMEYCLIAEALRGAGCRTITGVFTYLAYARQDSRFHAGEPLSSKVFARLIEDAGTDRFVTVDMHLHRFKNIQEVFRIPAVNLSAMPLLAQYYKNKYGAEDTTVTGPDAESEQWARIVAKELKAACTVLEKERKGDREVFISGELANAGKRVVLVDDMVSTGKTLIRVISMLKEQGVKRIDALVTHSLLVEKAVTKMKRAGLSELISTDTVPGSKGAVSVAPLIAEVLKG